MDHTKETTNRNIDRIILLTVIAVSIIFLLVFFIKNTVALKPLSFTAQLSDMQWNGYEGLVYAYNESSKQALLLKPDGTIIAEGRFTVYWGPSEDSIYISMSGSSVLHAYKNNQRTEIDRLPEDAVDISYSTYPLFEFDRWQCAHTYHDALISRQYFRLSRSDKTCQDTEDILISPVWGMGRKLIVRDEEKKETVLVWRSEKNKNITDIYLLGEESDKALVIMGSNVALLDMNTKQFAPFIDVPSHFENDIYSITILPVQ